MKRRITILGTLKINVPSNLQPLVMELFEEIKDYYIKMDIYCHFSKNVYLFKAIYIEGQTNIEISNDLPIDSKLITKFVKNTEDFTKNLINSLEKYRSLISYINKK